MGSLTEAEIDYPFNAIAGEPMEGLREEQKAEHEDEGYVEFIPEYGERQKGLGDEEPESVIQALYEAVRRSVQRDMGDIPRPRWRGESQRRCVAQCGLRTRQEARRSWPRPKEE